MISGNQANRSPRHFLCKHFLTYTSTTLEAELDHCKDCGNGPLNPGDAFAPREVTQALAAGRICDPRAPDALASAPRTPYLPFGARPRAPDRAVCVSRPLRTHLTGSR
jgi:hypothetical protein